MAVWISFYAHKHTWFPSVEPESENLLFYVCVTKIHQPGHRAKVMFSKMRWYSYIYTVCLVCFTRLSKYSRPSIYECLFTIALLSACNYFTSTGMLNVMWDNMLYLSWYSTFLNSVKDIHVSVWILTWSGIRIGIYFSISLKVKLWCKCNDVRMRKQRKSYSLVHCAMWAQSQIPALSFQWRSAGQLRRVHSPLIHCS